MQASAAASEIKWPLHLSACLDCVHSCAPQLCLSVFHSWELRLSQAACFRPTSRLLPFMIITILWLHFLQQYTEKRTLHRRLLVFAMTSTWRRLLQLRHLYETRAAAHQILAGREQLAAESEFFPLTVSTGGRQKKRFIVQRIICYFAPDALTLFQLSAVLRGRK